MLVEENKKSVAKMNRRIFSIPILIAALILVALVSGIFKYKLIAIATDSMKDLISSKILKHLDFIAQISKSFLSSLTSV